MFLIWDTETTGLPKDFNAPYTNTDNWPRLVQLAWQIHDDKGVLIEVKNFIVKPEGYTIPYNAEKIHGISTERAKKEGVDLAFVLEEFNKAVDKSTYCIGHNIGFDVNIMGAEYVRKETETAMHDMKIVDTKNESTNYCAIPGGRGGQFKWPTLTELHTKLFSEGFDEAHNASADVEATARCFLELVRLNVITANRLEWEADRFNAYIAHNPNAFKLIGLNIEPYSEGELEEVSNESEYIVKSTLDTAVKADVSVLKDHVYSHLHTHSQFSILQATADIGSLVKAAASNNMNAVALTDNANMYGTYHFVRDIIKHNKGVKIRNAEAKEKGEDATEQEIKPIVGCEFNICKDSLNKEVKDNGAQVVLLAKNRNGYHQLAKLSSHAFVSGFYYIPRIDKEILSKHKEDLIALTGGLYGEIPNLILNVGESQAEEAFVWWKEQFGENFYVELSRHGLEEEEVVNSVLISFAKKYNVKIIATNNTYYIDKDDANAHDILLCVKDAEKQATPIGRGRGFRYGFPNNEYYFKSQDEMKALFADLPDAITNIQAIVDQIEIYDLAREVLLPEFDIPEEFIDPEDKKDDGKRGENAYLKHLTYVGADKRYEEITPDIKERLDFELATIENTGYPGYFLIVQDFTSEARNMGVAVGPGRGSAAGSAVAYCIGITNVDPIAYDLLFERFLNPDRVSLPDIDIDFDDEGRGRIIDWVVQKYGYSQVAQIITYGTMAAKSSIRDTARVLDLPLFEADRIAKLVPDIKLKKLFGLDDNALADKLNADQLKMGNELKMIATGVDLTAQTINQARALEGSVRNTGIHACGVIIAPDDLTNYVPVSTAKDADLQVTQFDNSVVEDAGLLKMDFLGLKTLTIIKDAIKMIKRRHGVEIDPDEIPLDDVKTYELYQAGLTNGTFQFESAGMQKHLKSLKPDKFGDLIAMNALYRPGPLEYIPNFIARKHGDEEIAYDLEGMEEYLGETYGITVYQEQVMLLSQKLAGFSKGDADMLRKAMGKKIFALLEKMKPQFIEGGKQRGHNPKMLDKVWKDWEAFAAYAFNKSHSTCYSVVAFHTAYLKAHYPAEYMASVLTHNQSNIEKITFFMEECKNLGIKVLGPDVNESGKYFDVDNNGSIRFGLGAIKGAGDAAVEGIIEEREEHGVFGNLVEFSKRVNLRQVNKKTFEVMAMAGGFDCFPDITRRQYLYADEGPSYIEKIIKFGNKLKQEEDDAQVSLFGGDAAEGGQAIEIPAPTPPRCEAYSEIEKLNIEKEVVGFYITGHPLDEYKMEINHFCTDSIVNYENHKGKPANFAGIITRTAERQTKRGSSFGLFTVEDYNGAVDLALFGEEYLRYRHLLQEGNFIYMKGSVQTRYKSEDQWEFRANNIELLCEVRHKLCKGISIDINAEDVDEKFVEDIQLILADHLGSAKFSINLLDQEHKYKISMNSKKMKVSPSNKLIEALTAKSEILAYKIQK